MPDLEQIGTRNVPTDGAPDDAFDYSQIGQAAAFDFVSEPHYMAENVWVPEEFVDEGVQPRDISPLSEDARNALMELDRILSKADVAPRRIEIEQAWKAIHYNRGYQFLLPHRNGGWTVPGSGTGYGAGSQKYTSQMYATNVYGEKAEIITAALAREVPRVQFFPANPDYAPDQEMAEVADDLRAIWAKNNNLHQLLRDAAGIFYNEDRCLFWTRYEINGDEFGYEDPDQPIVPEDEQNPPQTPLETSEGEQYTTANESAVDSAAPRRPRGRVRTTAFGKLDAKVPIYVDAQYQMCGIQLCEDKDVSLAKAQFPWMIDKIHGGGDGTGETELDRVARENVRQAVPGQYVTGDSINRHTVVKHTYLRKSMFFDACVTEEVRKELLDKFPDGCCLVKAATEFAFARNENLDDHLTIGHPFPGKGQNRRAMGESLLPIQDYINELVSLSLDFAKRTIPKKYMDSEAFNVEALRNQTNMPGSTTPFQRQPGVPVSELIFVEPMVTPQPWLITYVQWIITNLSEQISGALPSLFGAQISGQVGSEGVAIQRDAAMQRVGCPWNSLQQMFAESSRQAAILTAKCANKDINDVIPGKGRVNIKLNQLKGAVLCYPESNPEFPESWAQKETRVMSLVDQALASPNAEFSQMILDPKNLKAIKSAIRLPEFVIKGAASVEAQEAELEILLRSGPVPNPEKMQAQQVLMEAQQGMAGLMQKAQMGVPLAPEEQQQAQQGGAMVGQLQQAIQSMPDVIPTIRAAQDASEEHEIRAGVLFDWMNGSNGRKFRYGNPKQVEAFANVKLLWQEHVDVAKKLAEENAPKPGPKPASFNIPVDKMSPEVQTQVLANNGIDAPPQVIQQHQTTEMNREIAKRIVPDVIYTSSLHKDSTPASEPTKKVQ